MSNDDVVLRVQYVSLGGKGLERTVIPSKIEYEKTLHGKREWILVAVDTEIRKFVSIPLNQDFKIIGAE